MSQQYLFIYLFVLKNTLQDVANKHRIKLLIQNFFIWSSPPWCCLIFLFVIFNIQQNFLRFYHATQSVFSRKWACNLNAHTYLLTYRKLHVKQESKGCSSNMDPILLNLINCISKDYIIIIINCRLLTNTCLI